ncbi:MULTISPECIES: hypothetical protein [unclassified Roseivivax]|uniref:hypothetical protein n=1 Tax=unclassified Roseivivax TaxID=2639302 RepID=UPI0012679C26|nr:MULTISPECIES: hypothetical protein [unclassified Roseivivax]
MFGEVGLGYGRATSEDFDGAADTITLQGGAAFVSGAGLGIQLDGFAANTHVDDYGDLDTSYFATHIYGDFGRGKVGLFGGSLNLGEIEIYDVGSADLDQTVSTYGIEGQMTQGLYTFGGYLGSADIEGVDDVDVTLIGVGGDVALSETLQLSANYDSLSASLDGVDDNLDVNTLSVGGNYFVAAGDAPVRLSAGLSRSSASFGGETSNATSVNVGATLLFGGSRNANRESLFDSFRVPF